jgi:hypothetical protein
MCQFRGPQVDVAHHPFTGSRHVGEVRMLEHAFLQDGKPNLDLIEPGRVNRRVDEMEPISVAFVEFRPALVGAVVVRVEVVPDDVDVAGRLVRGKLLQEGHSLVRGTMVDDFADDLAGGHLESGDQAARATSDVFVFLADYAILGDEHRVLASEHLDRLFVHTVHVRVRRRAEVKVAHPLGFGAKVGVRGGQPVAHQVRAQVVEVQDPPDFTDRKPHTGQRQGRRRQGLVCPGVAKRREFLIGPVAGQCHDLAPCRHADLGRSTGARQIMQGFGFGQITKPLLPLAHRAWLAADLPRYEFRAQARGGGQDDTSPLDQRMRQRGASRHRLQFEANGDRDDDWQRRWAGFAHAARIARDQAPVDPGAKFGFGVLAYRF